MDNPTSYAVVRVKDSVFGWRGLSKEKKMIAIVITKLMNNATMEEAQAECDRLNKLQSPDDSDDIYFPLYARPQK
jgi:hypothetical protein